MEGLNKQKWGMESWKWETSSPESYFTQWSTNIIIPKQRPNVMASKCWADLLQATPQRQALGSPWKSRRWPCKPWVKLEGPEAPKLNMKNPWYSSHSVVYSGIGDGRWGHDVCFLDAWVQVPGNQNAIAMEDQVPELQALQEDNIGICGDGVDFHGIWIGWSWIHIPFLCWFVKSPEKYDMCRWFSRFYQKNVAIDWGQCTMHCRLAESPWYQCPWCPWTLLGLMPLSSISDAKTCLSCLQTITHHAFPRQIWDNPGKALKNLSRTVVGAYNSRKKPLFRKFRMGSWWD